MGSVRSLRSSHQLLPAAPHLAVDGGRKDQDARDWPAGDSPVKASRQRGGPADQQDLRHLLEADNREKGKQSGQVALHGFVDRQNRVEFQLNRIKTAFLKHIEVNRNWASNMVFCEVLNLVNLVAQIYLTHIFLGRRFLTLGIDVLRDDFLGIMDTLDVVFPKVTKCHFHKFGASGSIQKHDGEAFAVVTYGAVLSFAISGHSSVRDGAECDKREDFHCALVLVLRADGRHNLIAGLAITDALSPFKVIKAQAHDIQKRKSFCVPRPGRPPSTVSCSRSRVPAR